MPALQEAQKKASARASSPMAQRCWRHLQRWRVLRCSGSAGNVVTGVANGTYAGQSLQGTHTLQPFSTTGQTNSQLNFTLGGAPLLTVETVGAGGVVTVTLTYGEAFSGIQRAQFINNGSTITGEIDGRAIVPLPANADPNSATFQDGGPWPNVQVDTALQAALRRSGDSSTSRLAVATGRPVG